MEQWKKNLAVLWVGQFLVMAGMTMIVPFLTLYLQSDLGLKGEHETSMWSGFIFAANFVTSFLFQPFWGKLSDRYGRKPMLLRSGFGMAIVMVMMGFATQPWQLLVLRMVNGTISGFNPASVSLVSSTTPKEKIGFAMGTLQSGGIAGTILGPFIGGLMADAVGFRPIFYITGIMMFLASLLSMFIVKERFDKQAAATAAQMTIREGFKRLSRVPQIPALFAATFLIQFAMMSPMTLIPLLVQKLHGTTENLAFYSGFVGSVTGLSNMIASPILGKLSDRIGSEKILGIALVGAAVMFIPQAFAQTVWQLLLARFALGIFLGGLVPSVNSLLRKYAPDGMASRAFGFNSSTLGLGNMVGPITGGILSGWIGIQGLFLLSAVLMFANSIWVYQTLLKRLKVPAKG
ncbi:putative MFS family arabinose efflux permease [Paenibacillus cellulosilyticus]|uniref:Putative MFS family arabinose efflux permease n=1 Tax=Paenibacillus cellulosilyticus TaxID=375489 RepID=A0A2V2YUV8_9BACL|nr:MFS transporter [Paenibacillus cellulosilyticus]PWV99691.1 putative MFS family arabinose efflux permease [Paenibacillus cellulosilyticus]QKS44873.1 MFS transporter [Paenibacillus cellulosilyticus]